MRIAGTFRQKPLDFVFEQTKGELLQKSNVVSPDFHKCSKNGISLFFYGRIYNRNQLDPSQKEKSLCRVLLENYLKDSYRSFLKINGKATIIVVEANKFTVFRDHWGEGPLIFYDGKYFAGDMQTILRLRNKNEEVDKVSLNTFLRYGFVPAPLTILKGVNKVPAGHVLIHDDGAEKLINLYDYREFKGDLLRIGREEALEEYGRLLKQSIRRRIEGSEPVGALLSGGYDSGGNIAVLREVFHGQVKSYSIGFRDNPFSELPYAAMMAKKFKSEHSEYLMDDMDIESLPQAVKAFGEPFSESGFMLNNAAMRFVKDEKLPVIIGGDGNDQMMGTTGKELALNFLIAKKGLTFVQKLFAAISNNAFFDKDNILFKLRFHNHKILNVMRPDNFGFNEHLMRDIFTLGKLEEHPVFAEIPQKYDNFEHFHDLHNFYLDIRHSINEVILNKASRLSEYYGVNLAFTYIDKDIYDFVKKLPLELRLKGSVEQVAKGRGVTKYIHKEYTKPKLPQEVTGRKKQGGFSPLAIFFADASKRNHIYRYISDSAFAKAFAREKALSAFFDNYERNATGEGYWFWYKQLKSNQLINLLIMALWWDIYLEGKEFDTVSEYLK